jgi:hypothetical protein
MTYKIPKSVGFPKPKIRGEGTFTPPTPKKLDKSCNPGDYIIIDGCRGILEKWQSNIAVIKVDGGGIKLIKC